MNERYRVLDLFTGIGGFALGLRRAGGFRTVSYCEIDPYCQAVLRARMQDGSLDTAPICTDVTRLDGEPWRGIANAITGGFPCQEISVANQSASGGLGLSGPRSGLWREYARIIRQVRPELVIVENSPALSDRGLDDVLGDLSEMGMDADWCCIRASSLGAKHRRERMFVVAYPHGHRLEGRVFERSRKGEPVEALDFLDSWPPISKSLGLGASDGIPRRVDRTRCAGNAVVPQVIEWIGRRINAL